MATNYRDSLEWHIRGNFFDWKKNCEDMMLEYTEWRMRCYSETLLTRDCPWNEFKRWFDFVYNGTLDEAKP